MWFSWILDIHIYHGAISQLLTNSCGWTLRTKSESGIQPTMVTHTRNSCSAFTHPRCTHTAVNTHTPWTHTLSSGQSFMLRRPGSSWGFGALLKGTSVGVLRVERALDIHSPHRQSLPDRDLNSQPLITSPTLSYSFGSQRRRSLFSLPVLPYFPCLLSSIVWSIERLSLHCSSNWEIMDLINWSLSAIDTIFSTRKLGFGEPVCPDGTFAAGYTRDAWERWQIVCLAALSVEDIEDIYLFRNNDNRSSADWIRLCPGLSKNSENGYSCPKPHKAARHDWSSGKSGQHWDWDY